MPNAAKRADHCEPDVTLERRSLVGPVEAVEVAMNNADKYAQLVTDAHLAIAAFRAPAGEHALRELRGQHLHQVGDVLDGGLWDLLDDLRELALL